MVNFTVTQQIDTDEAEADELKPGRRYVHRETYSPMEYLHPGEDEQGCSYGKHALAIGGSGKDTGILQSYPPVLMTIHE